MKKLLSLAAPTFFAMTALILASPEKDTVLQAEKNMWQYIKEKNFEAFEKNVAADFRGVYGDAINTRDKEFASVKKLDLKSFSLGDLDLVFIDKDAALITYTATTQGTQNGKDVSGKINAASVWKKEGSDWRVIFHSDVKAE